LSALFAFLASCLFSASTKAGRSAGTFSPTKSTVRLEHSKDERAIALFSGEHKLGFRGEADSTENQPMGGYTGTSGSHLGTRGVSPR
jgi:hypothetical protein